MSELALQLANKHGGVWGSHPTWGVEAWRQEVQNDNTRFSYWDWLMGQTEERAGGIEERIAIQAFDPSRECNFTTLWRLLWPMTRKTCPCMTLSASV